jgi:hypothetical protein
VFPGLVPAKRDAIQIRRSSHFLAGNRELRPAKAAWPVARRRWIEPRLMDAKRVRPVEMALTAD